MNSVRFVILEDFASGPGLIERSLGYFTLLTSHWSALNHMTLVSSGNCRENHSFSWEKSWVCWEGDSEVREALGWACPGLRTGPQPCPVGLSSLWRSPPSSASQGGPAPAPSSRAGVKAEACPAARGRDESALTSSLYLVM